MTYSPGQVRELQQLHCRAAAREWLAVDAAEGQGRQLGGDADVSKMILKIIIEDEEFCIKYEELCINNDEFCRWVHPEQNLLTYLGPGAFFIKQMMNFVL